MNIPQRWQDALRAIKDAGFPEAFIGGGALRDLDHGVEVKDVDIFVRWRGDETFSMLSRALYSRAALDVTKHDADYQTDASMVLCVFEFHDTALGTEPIQVIACAPIDEETPREFMRHQLDRFDIGLCKIGFDGKDLTVHSDYLADKQDEVLRLRSPRNPGRSEQRLRRIGERYPEHALIGFGGREVSREQETFDFAFD